MPRRPRSADDPPKRTPTFVCEVPLRVSRAQERVLLARLEAARQVHVTCLGQARRRVRLVRESKAYQHARTLPRDDPARKERFREARTQHGFSEYALHAYAQQFGHSWLGAHLDSLTIQTLATRAYRAANRLLVGKARRVRFKGRHQLDTVEGKTNTSGPRWRGTRVEWKGLELAGAAGSARSGAGPRARLPGQVRAPGPPQARRAQSLLRPAGVRGDAVPEAAAPRWAAGSSGWIWVPPPSRWSPSRPRSCRRSVPRWLPIHAALRRLDRQLDRQRRANNPANYDERGRVKRGQKRWKVSKRQRKVLARRREVHRKLAATRKRSHGQLAHRVLAMGSAFQLEHLSYRAWQKTYGKSVQLCAPGMFVERLSRLAASAGGTVVLINAWRARLSQTCHCGRIKKKARSQRWQVCPCGASAQRDLFSAYLARFVDPETSLQDAGQAQAAWPGWEPTRAAGVRAGHFEPTRVWQASACRLWSASGLIRVRVGRRLEGLRSRFSRALKCSPCGESSVKGTMESRLNLPASAGRVAQLAYSPPVIMVPPL